LYPAVKQHLISFGYDRLKQTGDSGARKKTNNQWFETQDSISYWDDFYKQKIVWGEISDKSNFALDNQDHFFVNNKCYLMSGNQLEYLVCFLNSPLSEYLFSKIGTTTGVGTAQWSKFTIEQLHIPIITEDQHKEFIFLVSELKSNRITKSSINNYIYRISNLTHEEIAFIEAL
jgi:adenine-specific DNA-methyltransferase